MNSTSFEDLIDDTKSTIRRFEKVEGKPWRAEGAMIELTKQVGELAKLIMSYEGYYYPERSGEPKYQASPEKIGNELSDIMHAVIRLADHYHIDLAEAFRKAKADEEKYLISKGI